MNEVISISPRTNCGTSLGFPTVLGSCCNRESDLCKPLDVTMPDFYTGQRASSMALAQLLAELRSFVPNILGRPTLPLDAISHLFLHAFCRNLINGRATKPLLNDRSFI